MEIHYNPYDPLVLADPYPVYNKLRVHAPVFWHEEADLWALSRHADVAEALRDEKTFSNANGTILEPGAWGPQARLFESLLAMDPPEHTRTRSLVAACFTRRRVAALESLAHQVVSKHLNPLLGCRAFDLVADFADALPADLLWSLIGVPETDRAHLGKLARVAAQCENPGSGIPPSRIEAALELAAYFAGLVVQRRRQPGDDLVSEVVGARVGRESLSDTEIVEFLNAVTSAANDTVGHLIGNAWYWAWRNPREKRIALGGAVKEWIDETLRYDTPTQLTGRTAVRDIELHGTRIPAQARIVLVLGAANRDPAAFPEPERYLLNRATQQSLGFGKGRHLCLGAGIARLLARVALGELAAHICDYEVDEPASQRAAGADIRGFARLPTAVTYRKSAAPDAVGPGEAERN
jgi:cytochrome P450